MTLQLDDPSNFLSTGCRSRFERCCVVLLSCCLVVLLSRRCVVVLLALWSLLVVVAVVVLIRLPVFAQIGNRDLRHKRL